MKIICQKIRFSLFFPSSSSSSLDHVDIEMTSEVVVTCVQRLKEKKVRKSHFQRALAWQKRGIFVCCFCQFLCAECEREREKVWCSLDGLDCRPRPGFEYKLCTFGYRGGLAGILVLDRHCDTHNHHVGGRRASLLFSFFSLSLKEWQHIKLDWTTANKEIWPCLLE